MLPGVVSVNGRITRADDAVVPVFDHGFLYGEGVYETLRTYARRPFLFDRHMARLRRSAGMIALDVPGSDEAMLAAMDRTAAEIPDGELYIRILVTRGVGELTYKLEATPAATVVIIVKPLPGFPATNYTQGIRLATVSVRRNHPSTLDPMIKSNNLMNTALAMQQAYRAGADEALIENLDGHVSECSQCNVFAVRGGAILTPPLTDGLLPGITRQVVLEVAQAAGLDAREAVLTVADIATADEVFVTSTTREITPVASLDGQPIGTGTPGPITRQVMRLFADRSNT